jgi:hypothetical protein
MDIDQSEAGAAAEAAGETGPRPAATNPDEGSDAGARPTSATDVPADAAAEEKAAEAAEKKRKKKRKKKRQSLGSSRGVETMFRTSYRVHQDLVSLADTKANIMISVNGLIISITLAALSPRMGGLPLLVLPVSVLLLGCLVALVYAVLAARPRVSSQPLTLEDIDRNDSNILFFGNFVNLSEDDFVRGMRNLMLTQDHLYINMVRDLYGLGQVLQTKFRLLRISYTVFMVALILGVGGFVLVFALDATVAQDLLDSGAMLPTIP